MTKRVFIIHGWDGHPEEGWFPWLKKELESRGFEVHVPAMPNPERPQIDTWVPFLRKIVGRPDEHTYFVGHSIGCQAILRFLETLDENDKIGGAVFVGGWFLITPASTPTKEDKKIYKEWRESANNPEKVKKRINKLVTIFSDNDPYVYLDKNRRIFEEKLGAKIIIEHGKGHFSAGDDITELPSALDSVLEMARK